MYIQFLCKTVFGSSTRNLNIVMSTTILTENIYFDDVIIA